MKIVMLWNTIRVFPPSAQSWGVLGTDCYPTTTADTELMQHFNTSYEWEYMEVLKIILFSFTPKCLFVYYW